MATYSTTTVINYALILCGATTVSTITDDTPNARALNSVYDFCRKDFQTENRWTFSTTRTTLATVATTTFAWLHDEEGYGYSRPSAALRIWEMSDLNAIWREEGEYIISDSADLEAKWAWDQTDHTKWQPAAVQAFSYYLASEIAFQIMNDPKKSQLLREYYQKIALPKATAQNSQTGYHQTVLDDFWLNTKFGTSGGDPSRSYS